MDTIPGLKELQVRKRDLLVESEMNRQALRVEMRSLRMHVEQYQRGYGWAQSAWKWAAPFAGFLFARKFQNTAGAFAKGSAVVNALSGIWRMWTSVKEKRKQASPDEPEI